MRGRVRSQHTDFNRNQASYSGVSRVCTLGIQGGMMENEVASGRHCSSSLKVSLAQDLNLAQDSSEYGLALSVMPAW